METYWKLRSATYTLTTEMWDPESGRLRRTRPRYVALARLETGEAARIERWEGNDFIQHGFDGVQEWAVMNGETLVARRQGLRRGTLRLRRRLLLDFGLPFKLKDPGVFLHYDGTDEEGRHQVRVTFGEGVGDHNDTWYYVFEEGSARCRSPSVTARRGARTSAAPTGRTSSEVDGYIFTGRRVHVNADGRIWKVSGDNGLRAESGGGSGGVQAGP